MGMGDKIRERRQILGMTQEELADKVGLQKSAIAKYENGRVMNIKRSMIEKLANALECNGSYLMDLDDKAQPKGVKIPVLGYVAAGIPIEAITDILDFEEITPELARTGNFFGLKIKGDSMAPSICDGDVVIVRVQPDAESGETVIAQVDGDLAACKRLRKFKNGIELISNNPAYEPMEFSNAEIRDLPVTIIGKVIELRRKF